MKLFFLVRPQDNIGYDEYDSFLIRAADEGEARSVAAEHAGDEGAGPWLKCECTVISSEGAPGLVIGSFNAG